MKKDCIPAYLHTHKLLFLCALILESKCLQGSLWKRFIHNCLIYILSDGMYIPTCCFYHSFTYLFTEESIHVDKWLILATHHLTLILVVWLFLAHYRIHHLTAVHVSYINHLGGGEDVNTNLPPWWHRHTAILLVWSNSRYELRKVVTLSRHCDTVNCKKQSIAHAS